MGCFGSIESSGIKYRDEERMEKTSQAVQQPIDYPSCSDSQSINPEAYISSYIKGSKNSNFEANNFEISISNLRTPRYTHTTPLIDNNMEARVQQAGTITPWSVVTIQGDNQTRYIVEASQHPRIISNCNQQNDCCGQQLKEAIRIIAVNGQGESAEVNRQITISEAQTSTYWK